MDSQEVVFIQDVVGLTETDYSFLVSISGIGFALGALFITVISKMLSLKKLMGYGMLLTAAGYLIYALADSFMTVAAGFIILGIFNAFSSAGYQTFYQNNVPVEIMGRMTSVIGVIQSLAQIILLLGIGVLGDLFPLRYTIVISAVLNLLLSFYVCWQLLKPGKQQYFSETTST
jgi:predicted MFS family arabinose efflux permease